MNKQLAFLLATVLLQVLTDSLYAISLREAIIEENVTQVSSLLQAGANPFDETDNEEMPLLIAQARAKERSAT